MLTEDTLYTLALFDYRPIAPMAARRYAPADSSMKGTLYRLAVSTPEHSAPILLLLLLLFNLELDST